MGVFLINYTPPTNLVQPAMVITLIIIIIIIIISDFSIEQYRL